MHERAFRAVWLAHTVCLCMSAGMDMHRPTRNQFTARHRSPQTLMVELHSNFTADGQKSVIDGVYPSNHQDTRHSSSLRGSTIVGDRFYVFTSEQNGHGVSGSATTSALESASGILDWPWSQSLHRVGYSATYTHVTLGRGRSAHHRQGDRVGTSPSIRLERTWHVQTSIRASGSLQRQDRVHFTPSSVAA